MRIFFSFICLVLLISCANQGTLVGGPKDETPPVLLGSFPQMGSTNFNSNRFVLEFDENIQVKNLNQNLLVSPFLQERPKVKVRPQSIEVEFEEELQPNTTYTFNFGNAIQDLNENNELAGFTYVFSTGDEIDQATFSGTAIDAATGVSPNEGFWALLYDSDVDSLFTTTPPRYATPIREDGTYQFQNLKEGSYQLFALKDNNSNYYYDLPNEQIAFISEMVTVGDSLAVTEQLQLFEPTPLNGFVSRTISDKPNSLLLETSTNPDRFFVEFFPSIEPKYKSTSISENKIRYWFDNNELPDSLALRFDNQLVDTISIRPFEEEFTDSLFILKLNGQDNYTSNTPITLRANRPFTKNEIGDPVLLEDSLFVAGGVELILDSLDANQYTIDYAFEYDKDYILQFDDSLFTDIYGLPSDSLGVRFITPDKESLSILNIDLISELYVDTPLVFELSQGENVFLTRYLSSVDEDVMITDLKPGKYSVKIIIDENGNQQWDTGNYIEKRQPEQIINFNTPLETRANWDVDVQINLDE